MKQQMNRFPQDFLWGASISAYQAEGAVLEDGKQLSIADLSTQGSAYCDNSVSSDFYHHYKEDIKLLAEMKAKTFRFSLAWPRIIPDGEGEVNEKGIEFYNHILDELDKYDIKPIVTLFHYDLPVALQNKYGGWKSREVVNAFKKFVKICFERFGKRIKMYLTINEPDILLTYGGHGLDLDGEDDFEKYKLIINHHFALAHAHAVTLCHEMVKDAVIGPVFGYVPVYPKSCKPLDNIAARDLSDIQNSFFQELFLNGYYLENALHHYLNKSDYPDIRDGDMKLLANAKSDYVALNYYKSDVVEFIDNSSQSYQVCENDYLESTQWGWEIDAVGIRAMLRDVHSRYHLPIIIAENGMANHEVSDGERIVDQYRIDYMQTHLHECKKAIEEGVQLIGYCAWSFIDLLSTSHGFEKRYGLIYVDRNNESDGSLQRIPKESYYWYKKTITEHGENL